MSKNCIRCVVNRRDGPDLLCEACRQLEQAEALTRSIMDRGAARTEFKRIHRAFDPTCAFYLARTKVDQQLHHVVATNFMTEEMVLCNPETQAPPTYMANFDDVEIVGRNDNPEQPRGTILTTDGH